jgi:hypothetical protein
MATVLDINGERAIKLNGSEVLRRQFTLPSGSTDVRIGMYLSAETGSQTFNPSVSVYETFQIGLVHGLTGAPTGLGDSSVSTTSSNYIGYGNNIGQGCVAETYINNSVLEGIYIGNNGSIAVRPSYKLSGVWGTSGGSQFDLPIRPTQQGKCTLVMLRVRVAGSIITSEIRYVHLNTVDEDSMHTKMSDLSSTGPFGTRTMSFDTAQQAQQALESLDTFFFAWPFFNIPIYVHAMAFRAI